MLVGWAKKELAERIGEKLHVRKYLRLENERETPMGFHISLIAAGKRFCGHDHGMLPYSRKFVHFTFFCHTFSSHIRYLPLACRQQLPSSGPPSFCLHPSRSLRNDSICRIPLRFDVNRSFTRTRTAAVFPGPGVEGHLSRSIYRYPPRSDCRSRSCCLRRPYMWFSSLISLSFIFLLHSSKFRSSSSRARLSSASFLIISRQRKRSRCSDTFASCNTGTVSFRPS